VQRPGREATHLEATASHPGDAEALWSTLHDALGLCGEGATVEVRGATGTVERVGERQTLVRLTAPMRGMISVFAWDEGGGKATAGVRAYLFSADAADYVRREEPAWQAWLQGISVPAWSLLVTESGPVDAVTPPPYTRHRSTQSMVLGGKSDDGSARVAR
jgi:hypothetical protein